MAAKFNKLPPTGLNFVSKNINSTKLKNILSVTQ